MAIPTYDQMIHPLLLVLAESADGIRSRDAYEAVAAAVGLTDEDKQELLPSGKQAVYRNRIGWAHDRLKRAGWSESAKRGHWQITPAGTAALNQHQNGFDESTLRGLCQVAKPGEVGTPDGGDEPPPVGQKSPLERLQEAARELDDSLAAELLDQVSRGDPEFFERLVLDVLHKMGYGTSAADLVRTQTGADEGIDGIITLDRLGLEKIYVQAKRWTAGTVGRPEVQKFFGALAGQGANRGVFITTSSFTKGAIEYARQVTGSIVLVDGKKLADLMIEYGVGVTVHETVRIARIDQDYFEDS